MQPWLTTGWGNPSSLYQEGRQARAAIDQARESVSSALGCLFGEVIFTGSGTEAANVALLGCALGANAQHRPRILVSAAEHHCVLLCGPTLFELGFRLEMVPVDCYGRTDLSALETQMGPDVLLVAAMHANNELGTLQDPHPISELAHRHGALYFCDAVQTFAHGDLSVDTMGADLVAIAAHKRYGPKGIGALMIRAGTRCEPLIRGGGQERDMRAGTENVAAIAGFGAVALERQGSEGAAEAANAFYRVLENDLEDWCRTVPENIPTLPGFVHVLVRGIDAETLLIRLDRAGVSASAGAACSSGSLNPSHVLVACGYSEAEARTGVRLTFGRGQNGETGAEAARLFVEAVRGCRTRGA